METAQNKETLDSIRPQYGAIYFFGSGASASSGAPTFGNFFEKALDISKKLKDDDTYQKVLNEWRRVYSGYNIEEYFSEIELSEMITTNKYTGSIFRPVTTQEVTNFIAKTIEQSLDNINSKHYEAFLRRIVNPKLDTVVTTNWDILLEKAIPGKLSNGDFNYHSVHNYYNTIKVPTTSSVSILKLHGSLNWAQCQSCHKVYYFDEKVYSRFYETPSMIPECNSCDKENKKLLPIIVPPTFSKLKTNVFTATDDEWDHEKFLNHIWGDAYYKIAFSKEIYFIGYSFPQSDAQMKIFISMALRANKSLQKIIVVSNEKFGQEKVDFEEHYKPIIQRCVSKPKIQFLYDGFEGFCEGA